MAHGSLNPTGGYPDLHKGLTRCIEPRESHATRGQYPWQSFSGIRNLVRTVWKRAQVQSRQRQAVRILTANEVRDLGMTREQVLFDLHKSIWRG